MPDDGFNRFEGIHILKRQGSQLPRDGEKPRWSRTLIDHLELLVSMTQDRDWHDGKPIVWMSVGETAARLGISPSQVNTNEKQLFALGALTWTDSGNHKRYGRRNERGRIIYAYGINLAPFGHLTGWLKEMNGVLDEEASLWKIAKREFSAMKRKIRGVFDYPEDWPCDLSAAEADFEAIIAEMRIQRSTDTGQVRGWIKTLEELLLGLDSNAIIEIAENSQKTRNMPTSGQEYTTLGTQKLEAHIIQDSIPDKKNNTSKGNGALPPKNKKVARNHVATPKSAKSVADGKKCHEGGGSQVVKPAAKRPDTRPKEVVDAWSKAEDGLRSEVGDARWQSWIKPLDIIEITGGRAKLSAPSRFVANRVKSQFTDRIRLFLTRAWGQITDIEIVVVELDLPPEKSPKVSANASDNPIRDIVNLGRFVGSLPPNTRKHLPQEVSWDDLADLSYRLCRELGISDDAWDKARQVMGLDCAALIILVIAAKREYGKVKTPGGYLRGMIRKARNGLFNLMPSIYGVQEMGVG